MRIVDRGPPQGKILLSTRSLLPGTTILQEEPVILVKGGKHYHPLGIYRAFLAASPAVQSQVLDFFSPTTGARSMELRADLLAGGSLGGEQVEECVKLFSVFELNGVAVSPTNDDGGTLDLGIGLYATAGKASHSCQPNCTWLPDQQGRRVVRTLTAVAEGEELCIDYLSEGMDLQPVHQRRARLMAWNFLCGCPRCAAHGDDTRRFPCMETTCKGHHLAHQPTAEDQAELTACRTCGTLASPSYTSRMLQREADLSKELARIRGFMESGARHGDVRPLVRRLQPPHPHHHLAAAAAHLQVELYLKTEQWMGAAKAISAYIACRDAIIHLPSRTTAHFHEHRGDALMQVSMTVGAGAGAGEKRWVLRAQAEEAYRCAAQGMLITCGPSHPSTTTAAAYLAAATQG